MQGGLSLRALWPVELSSLWAAACRALFARRRDFASATWIFSSLVFLSASASSASMAAWCSSSSLRRVSRRVLSALEPPRLLEPSPAPAALLATAALAAASNRPGLLSSTLRLTTPMDARSAMRRVTFLLLFPVGCSSSSSSSAALTTSPRVEIHLGAHRVHSSGGSAPSHRMYLAPGFATSSPPMGGPSAPSVSSSSVKWKMCILFGRSRSSRRMRHVMRSSFKSKMLRGVARIVIQWSPFWGTRIMAGSGWLPAASSCLDFFWRLGGGSSSSSSSSPLSSLPPPSPGSPPPPPPPAATSAAASLFRALFLFQPPRLPPFCFANSKIGGGLPSASAKSRGSRGRVVAHEVDTPSTRAHFRSPPSARRASGSPALAALKSLSARTIFWCRTAGCKPAAAALMTCAHAAHSRGGYCPACFVRRRPRLPTWKPSAVSSSRILGARIGTWATARPPCCS